MNSKTLTYCNPLPLPNYQAAPSAKWEKSKKGTGMGHGLPRTDGWLHEVPRDFREMADPTVLKFKNKWYIFPSYGLIWYSDDMVNWEYQPVAPFDKDLDLVAPTAVEKDGFIYMTACGNKMWRAEDPFGPWTMIGNIKDENGEVISLFDPMLFVDDDGALYCYFSSAREIFAVKMKDSDPTAFDGLRVRCFGYNPEHVWERYGEFNQDIDRSWIEGPWITKHNGRYYLQYCGPGTEYKCYSIGCYVGDNPLGPFDYQNNNPILRQNGGLISGTGHHSLVEGPDGNLWCFYTMLVRIEYKFERRIAMDPVGFDDEGNMYILGPSETPQFAPGVVTDPVKDNSAGLLPLSVNEYVSASGYMPGHEPVYAVDNYIRTWWEAPNSAEPQWLCVDLGRQYDVYSARTMFADRGLDYSAGILPGPYSYSIMGSVDGREWLLLIEKSDNATDRHIEYDTWDPQKIRYVKLVVSEAPAGMRIGVWEFTVFGKP